MEMKSNELTDISCFCYENSDLYILEIEGTGSRGWVVKAIDKKSLDSYALKCIRTENDKKAYENAMKEMKILKELGKLENPNLVKFYDSHFEEKESKKLFILKLEYATCNMEEIFLHRKDTTQLYLFANLLYIAREFVHGLEEAKLIGICHKDIKLSNLLYSKDSSKYLIGD